MCVSLSIRQCCDYPSRIISASGKEYLAIRNKWSNILSLTIPTKTLYVERWSDYETEAKHAIYKRRAHICSRVHMTRCNVSIRVLRYILYNLAFV